MKKLFSLQIGKILKYTIDKNIFYKNNKIKEIIKNTNIINKILYNNIHKKKSVLPSMDFKYFYYMYYGHYNYFFSKSNKNITNDMIKLKLKIIKY